MRKVEKRLRERITTLEEENKRQSADLEIYRKHFSKRFRWWIELLGKHQTPSLSYLIEDDAKVLHTVKSWWWG